MTIHPFETDPGTLWVHWVAGVLPFCSHSTFNIFNQAGTVQLEFRYLSQQLLGPAHDN